jgi:hypothetical protein
MSYCVRLFFEYGKNFIKGIRAQDVPQTHTQKNNYKEKGPNRPPRLDHGKADEAKEKTNRERTTAKQNRKTN